MNGKILEILNNTADDFGKVAKKVNESSRKRKNYSEEAINYLDLCMEIGEELDKGLESVAKSNIEERNQDAIVLNICRILKSNIEIQKNLLKDFQKKNAVGKEILDGIFEIIKDFSHAIEEALPNIERIIEKDNQIIMLDKLIRIRKQYQQEAIQMLKDLAATSLKDAEKAIQGSSSNLERGLKMVERFKNVETLINEKNIRELNNLVEDANKGWNVALTVNKSSNSQFEFAEKVNGFTAQLHEDTVAIKDLVVQKHHEYEETLQMVTVLTVVLSIKFKKYLSIETILDNIELTGNIRDLLLNMMAYVKIACADIRDLTAMNYDMTESSNLNNVVEDNALKATKKELEYFEGIKKEVKLMTEATRYPVEGSGKNITNGQILEKHLKEIIAGLQ